ncbi:MAG: MerR family transcriptional regulator [Bacteroidetes bacterium]|nr:MAG: MerR family transcriptional regulator [Bacteroidota bacterium]REK05109.1 MAG: MerR family transcriptional regulator [Bacteroidota bacterium]REK32514.1 MAG: MerR family transcriptional regulator [Bacteroidota bacterium]REK49039.1 MAG: MerR family transcriptional regulator [Bacteroidota bacterium]
MPYKEKEIEKLYYTIGEVAQMFSVNTSHIRFWSKEFDVIKPATNKKGNRLYTMSDIDNFKKIYHLVKEKGFTLKGAKAELKESRLKDREVSFESSSFRDGDLQDNPIEIPFPSAREEFNDDFVGNIAVMNSLGKMKSSLLELQKELSKLD